ncbi:hypothetical protein NEIG_00981 [Nematocida sp. ERTm5]|nr:hypothetical protein NEIG_00981 [Nematocida sp. ERTm5]
MHWLFEIESRPESEIGDIAIESQAQVTRMDKVSEDWTNEDWKEFIEHMLEHIEKKKELVLVKPPRIQDFGLWKLSSTKFGQQCLPTTLRHTGTHTSKY